jgi:phytoene synthase
MPPDAELAGLPAQRPASSFHMAMQVLPAPQREAMFGIYAFCRAVDDIADGSAPPSAKCAALERWRDDVDACYLDRTPARLRPLAPHIAAYGLAREDFHAVIDGMLMDAQARPICAPEAATLDLYCDRVASAVGRLSVRVFGMPPGDGPLLAHHLGRALQLTNILRDIDEDAAIGRVYLPRELLLAAGVEECVCAAGAVADAGAIAAHPALPKVCAEVAAQASWRYGAAQEILRRNPGTCSRAPRLMGAVYQALLARLLARGWDTPRAAVRVGKLARIGILLRAFGGSHAIFGLSGSRAG